MARFLFNVHRDVDLKHSAKSIRFNTKLPGHNGIHVEFWNGMVASIIKGPASFGMYEIMIFKKNGTPAKTEDGDTISRYETQQEVIEILRKTAQL